MFVVQFADTLDALHRRFITDVTAKGVAGVGWINNQATLINNRYRLLDQSHLRVIGMNFEVLRHGSACRAGV